MGLIYYSLGYTWSPTSNSFKQGKVKSAESATELPFINTICLRRYLVFNTKIFLT